MTEEFHKMVNASITNKSEVTNNNNDPKMATLKDKLAQTDKKPARNDQKTKINEKANSNANDKKANSKESCKEQRERLQKEGQAINLADTDKDRQST